MNKKLSMKKEIEKTLPLAFFITFSCYGTHLHWQESGSVDRDNNQFGKPFLSLDAKKYQHNKKKMKQNPYIIDNKRGEIILKSIIETSMYRQWNLLAAHIRSTHVHIIIQAMVNPEKVMNDLKAYASRALNKSGFDDKNQKRWTRHGSTRYLWKIENIEQAIHYVLYEQGEPMVIYENKSMDIENFFNKTY
jgi:REP element-mobilizing transposase RayT